jgi:hypothetical protein
VKFLEHEWKLQGSDGGVVLLTLPTVRYSKQPESTKIPKLGLFALQVRGKETSTLLGPLKRAKVQ